MMKEPLMVFDISLKENEISCMKTAAGDLLILPFTGHTEGPLFCGTVLPGAVDVQTPREDRSRLLCARYMFAGTDENGTPCRLYVENSGVVQPEDAEFTAKPVFVTDSPVLAARLQGKTFYTKGRPKQGGVDILVYEA